MVNACVVSFAAGYAPAMLFVRNHTAGEIVEQLSPVSIASLTALPLHFSHPQSSIYKPAAYGQLSSGSWGKLPVPTYFASTQGKMIGLDVTKLNIAHDMMLSSSHSKYIHVVSHEGSVPPP